MNITPAMIKELRERSGAGFMDCKGALVESGGDIDAAIDALRKKGLASAAKKAGRIAAEGAVGSYIHAGGKIGVLVEVNCETDFVALTDEFQSLVRDIAMHIAAAEPKFLHRDEVTQADLDREREIFKAQARETGKPEAVIERIAEGKMEKFYSTVVLLEQDFVKNPDLTIGDMIKEKIAKIGENIVVRRFSRFKLGEGIEKRQDDFVKEVMAQVGQAGA